MTAAAGFTSILSKAFLAGALGAPARANNSAMAIAAICPIVTLIRSAGSLGRRNLNGRRRVPEIVEIEPLVGIVARDRFEQADVFQDPGPKHRIAALAGCEAEPHRW